MRALRSVVRPPAHGGQPATGCGARVLP